MTRSRMRARLALAAAAAVVVAGLAGCSSTDEGQCTEDQLNALLSATGIAVPSAVTSLASEGFEPADVVSTVTPSCTSHLAIDVAGVKADGSVAVVAGGQTSLDAVSAQLTAMGWNPATNGQIVTAVNGSTTITAAPVAMIVTDETQLAQFDGVDDAIVVVSAQTG